jgi:hypothetical protein
LLQRLYLKREAFMEPNKKKIALKERFFSQILGTFKYLFSRYFLQKTSPLLATIENK